MERFYVSIRALVEADTAREALDLCEDAISHLPEVIELDDSDASPVDDEEIA